MQDGATALLLAGSCRHVEVVTHLIEAVAPKEQISKGG